MKNIREFSDVISRLASQPPALEDHKVSLNQEATQNVNMVFEQLKITFPASAGMFEDQRWLDLTKKSWVKAFIENGITDQALISAGFRKARKSSNPWLPSVGQFIAWCKPEPEDYGLPSVEDAYVQVVRRLPPSHPIVVKTAKATSFERGTLTETEYKRVFARHYEILVERIMKGETFDYEVPKGIGSEATHSPEYYTTKCKQGVATLRNMLRRKQAAHSPVLHGSEISGLIDDEKELVNKQN